MSRMSQEYQNLDVEADSELQPLLIPEQRRAKQKCQFLMCFVFKIMIILMVIAGTATAIVLLKFHHEEKPAGVVDEGVPVAPVLGHQDHPQQAGQAQLYVAHTPALDDGLVPVADPGRGDVLDQSDDQLEVGQDVEEHDNKKKNIKYIFVGILAAIRLMDPSHAATGPCPPSTVTPAGAWSCRVSVPVTR